MLREAEVTLGQGQTVKDICWKLGITDPTYYRGGRCMEGSSWIRRNASKSWSVKTAWLKRAVADLTLDKLILKEAAEGTF